MGSGQSNASGNFVDRAWFADLLAHQRDGVAEPMIEQWRQQASGIDGTLPAYCIDAGYDQLLDQSIQTLLRVVVRQNKVKNLPACLPQRGIDRNSG